MGLMSPSIQEAFGKHLLQAFSTKQKKPRLADCGAIAMPFMMAQFLGVLGDRWNIINGWQTD